VPVVNKQGLELIDVYIDEEYEDQQYIKITEFPEILTYGKHAFKISINDPINNNKYLRDGSYLSLQLQDGNGNDIFCDVEDIINSGENILAYVWLKYDLERTYESIRDGIGTLTIVGELDNVPLEWKNRPNFRTKYPVNINTKILNYSPLIFKDVGLIQSESSTTFSSSLKLDKGDSVYERGYLTISSSNLDFISGKLNSIEITYLESRSKSEEYKLLTNYVITGSPYEITDSFGAKGELGSLSFQKDIILPRDIREDENIKYKLRFLNQKNEYAIDYATGTEAFITSSYLQTDGSPMIIDKPMTITGKLTAAEYILSSSVKHETIISSSGRLEVVGNITASGDISASGYLKIGHHSQNVIGAPDIPGVSGGGPALTVRGSSNVGPIMVITNGYSSARETVTGIVNGPAGTTSNTDTYKVAYGWNYQTHAFEILATSGSGAALSGLVASEKGRFMTGWEGQTAIGTDTFSDSTLTVGGDISASGDYYAGDGIYLGGVKRTTWPGTGTGGTSLWYDGTTYQSSSMEIRVDGTISSSSTIHALSHITSSGNILASSADPRIRVEATAGNHPGYEWWEAGTRKWVIFNDPANDHMTWKNASGTELMELDQDGQLGIGAGNPTVKLQVAGDISGSELFLNTDSSPMVNLNRTDSAGNAAIQYKNTNGYMIAGIDEDAQNSGANIFGIGYHGDLIDNDGSNHATFVVTGSQVVINNATSASGGSALTVGGDITTTGHISASGDIKIKAGNDIRWYNSGDDDSDTRIVENSDNLYMYSAGDLEFTAGMKGSIASDGDIKFEVTNGVEKFRYDGGLDTFGIGTTTPSKKLTVAGDISASGNFYGKQYVTYFGNFQGDIATSTYYIPLGTHGVEVTSADNEDVGFIAPFDGEIVKVMWRQNYDMSSSTQRFGIAIVPSGTDLTSLTTSGKFRATVTGMATDTVGTVTVADADSASTDDMTFSKGDTVFVYIRNGADNSLTFSEHHITAVFLFDTST